MYCVNVLRNSNQVCVYTFNDIVYLLKRQNAVKKRSIYRLEYSLFFYRNIAYVYVLFQILKIREFFCMQL